MIEFTKKELADEMGISLAAVEQWQRDGLPHARKGNRNVYRLREVIAFLRERDGSEAIDPRREQGLLHRANRKLRELQHAKEVGEVIPADEVIAHWGNMVANARARLLGLPNRLAPLAMGSSSLDEAAEHSRKLIYEALQALADDTGGMPPQRVQEQPASTE